MPQRVSAGKFSPIVSERGKVATYEFVCSNLYPECDERIERDTEEEVLEQAAVHMREHHGMIELPSDMTRWVLSSVRPDDR